MIVVNSESKIFVTESLNVSFFAILFYVPFKITCILYGTGKSVDGTKTGEPREKPPGTTAEPGLSLSHAARAGLEPTSDTAVRPLNVSIDSYGTHAILVS